MYKPLLPKSRNNFLDSGLTEREGNRRGYRHRNNAFVNVFGLDKLELLLAVDTSQIGRTFQDRFVFLRWGFGCICVQIFGLWSPSHTRWSDLFSTAFRLIFLRNRKLIIANPKLCDHFGRRSKKRSYPVGKRSTTAE